MPCEDGIVTTTAFVAVVDGSTSKGACRLRPDKSNGQWCMELVCQCIATAPPLTTMEHMCQLLTSHVRSHYAPSQLQAAAIHPKERMAASCIVYSNALREIWMIGDCQCLIDGKLLLNDKPCERIIAAQRARMAKYLMATQGVTADSLQTHDIARQAIMPQLIQAMQGQNTQYAVIDGFPVAMQGVKKLPLSAKAHTVVLATDGYPHLKPSLAESEAALAKQLAQDPLCIDTYKATKGLMAGNNSFDDRAYVKMYV